MNDKISVLKNAARIYRVLSKASCNFRPGFFVANKAFFLKSVKNYLSGKRNIIKGPRSMGIGVCNDCNIKCLYCFEHSPLRIEHGKEAGHIYFTAKMKEEAYRRLVDELSDLGNTVIRFVGRGESFMHPGFLDMCAYAIKKGQICDITTNGSLINKEQAKAIVDLGIRKLDISIGAGFAQTYQKITCADNGIFEGILDIIRIITEYRKSKNTNNPYILITNVLCSMNYTEIFEMLKKGAAAGVDAVGFHKMYFCKKRKPLIENLIINENQKEELISRLFEGIIFSKKNNLQTNIPFLISLLKREGNLKTMDYKRMSYKMKNGGMVLADGAVYAWEYPQALGNINEESFRKIWYSTRYRQIREQADNICSENKLFPCATFCRVCDQ